jgi:hypothetical protein
MPRLAIGMAAVFALTVVVLHFVRTDVDPLARGVSRYAVGDYGSIVNVVFLSLGVALAATGIGFRANAPGASPTGISLLWLSAAGIAFVAFFPLQSADSRATENLPHQLGGMVFFVAAAAGIVLLSRGTKRTTLGWITAAAVTVYFLSIGVPALLLTGIRGLLQRGCFAAIVTWLILANVAADTQRAQRRQSASSTP